MFSEASVMTVGMLTSNIKRALQSSFSSVIVKGEMSNVTLHSRGHLYFDLKDEEAKIACVCFNFKTKSSVTPKDGDAVVIQGGLTVYAPYGRYQITVERITFSGIGALLLKFEEMKKGFTAKGYFDAAVKKPLPREPRRIGIITSPTGAVIRDIINVLTRRSRAFTIIIHPVKVQGTEAAAEIAGALEVFNHFNLADLVILARGGGSIEDLWAFNEPTVVEAIFKSRIPIVSAVGHETDFTLADFVADVRAPTPSAAAEIVMKESLQEENRLLSILKQAKERASYKLKAASERLVSIKKRLYPTDFHLDAMQRLDYIKIGIDQAQKNILFQKKLQLSTVRPNLSKLSFYNIFRDQQRYVSENLTLTFLNRINFLKQKFENYRAILDHLRFTLKNYAVNRSELLRKGERLTSEFSAQIDRLKKGLEDHKKDLDQATLLLSLTHHKQRLIQCCDRLNTLHPNHAFKRGFAMLLDFNTRSAILSKTDLVPNLSVIAVLEDGEALLSVSKEPIKVEKGN